MTDMNFATIIGLVAAVGVFGAAILVGGDFMSLVDVGSMMIVIVGTIAATILRFKLDDFFVADLTALKVRLGNKTRSPSKVVERLRELSQIACKEGLE